MNHLPKTYSMVYCIKQINTYNLGLIGNIKDTMILQLHQICMMKEFSIKMDLFRITKWKHWLDHMLNKFVDLKYIIHSSIQKNNNLA